MRIYIANNTLLVLETCSPSVGINSISFCINVSNMCYFIWVKIKPSKKKNPRDARTKLLFHYSPNLKSSCLNREKSSILPLQTNLSVFRLSFFQNFTERSLFFINGSLCVIYCFRIQNYLSLFSIRWAIN